MAASISMRSEDVKTGGIVRDPSVKRYADVGEVINGFGIGITS